MRTAALLLTIAACSNDPLYVAPDPSMPFVDSDGSAPAQTRLELPIKLETMRDAAERAMRTATLGVDVPYVKVGDIDVSVEWRVTNLTGMPGEVQLQLNGANELFRYDPVAAAVGLDPDEPQPPGLEGDIPLKVPAMGTLTGLFREDQVREASIDLDQITRGNINPFRATLTISKNATEFSQLSVQTFDADGEPLPQMPTGIVYPREAFAQIVWIELVFKPDRLMRLEYAVRVRDHRGIMHDLLDAARIEAPGELQVFAPVDYVPPAPP